MMALNIENIKRQLLNHGYELIKQIGQGSYSNVFLCKSLKYNDLFSVKRISNEKFKEFEISTLCNLHHSNIIQLYETFNDEEAQYLVMEYCPNDTIKKKNKLKYDQFIYYSKQILEALSFCHSKLIAHRDIKPDNIFISKYDRVKLADFGFAKRFDNNNTSSEHCGSIMYCSPEIVQNKALFNPFQADIYALGITFFYMITGKNPFPKDSIQILKKSIVFGQIDFSDFDVDEELQIMIKKMTSRHPQSRPTAYELLKLPIYDQTNPVSNYFCKKEKITSSSTQPIIYLRNQSTPYLTLSNQFNPTVSKKRVSQKKFISHKCSLVIPNISKINL